MPKAISIFLSLLLLVNSSGLAYGQHFCGGFLMEAGLVLNEAELSCGMEKPDVCENVPSTSIGQEKHCCDNNIYQVDTDDHFNGHKFDFETSTDFSVAILAPIYRFSSYQIATNPFSASGYDPPTITRDVCVDFQVFLI